MISKVRCLKELVTVVAVFGGTVGLANAVPVFTNPSFENGSTGWAFSGAFVNSGAGPGFDGTYWAWVGRADNPNTLITQTVGGFTIGNTYDLTFLLGTECFACNGGFGDTVNVAIAGAGTINQDFTQSNAPTSTTSWGLWEQQTYQFVADAVSLTFAIHGYPSGYGGHNSYDAGVDLFQIQEVSSVPLPAALPLLATGLGALGLLGWCRKRKVQAAA